MGRIRLSRKKVWVSKIFAVVIKKTAPSSLPQHPKIALHTVNFYWAQNYPPSFKKHDEKHKHFSPSLKLVSLAFINHESDLVVALVIVMDE